MPRKQEDRRDPDEVDVTLARLRAAYARLLAEPVAVHEWRRLRDLLLSAFVDLQARFIDTHHAIAARIRSDEMPRNRETTRSHELVAALKEIRGLRSVVDRHLRALADPRKL